MQLVYLARMNMHLHPDAWLARCLAVSAMQIMHVHVDICIDTFLEKDQSGELQESNAGKALLQGRRHSSHSQARDLTGPGRGGAKKMLVLALGCGCGAGNPAHSVTSSTGFHHKPFRANTKMTTEMSSDALAEVA